MASQVTLAFMELVSIIVLALIVAKWAVQLWLEQLNRRNVIAHAGAVPDSFREFIDEPTYKKSIAYTLARGSLSQKEMTHDAIILSVVLCGGFLPWLYEFFQAHFGKSIWAG